MTDNGGEASLMYEKPRKEYDGNTQAGITSALFFNTEKEGMSFVVIGSKLDTTGYFKEDYTSSEIDENYNIWEHKRAAKGPARW